MQNRFLVSAATAFLFVGSAAYAEQAATMDGVVSKIDEASGKITVQHGQPGTVGSNSNDQTEDFKVSDGLLFNALQPGDKVQFSVEQKDGVSTITQLKKRP